MNRLLFILSVCLFISMPLLSAENNLMVGLSTTDVTPSVDDQIPLGGYGSVERRNWPPRIYRHPFIRTFRPSLGELDPIRVKSMYLQKENKKLLFISLDVIGVSGEMRQDIIQRIKEMGIPASSIIISGTHTHSGPGGLSNNLFWQIFAMDRFQRKFYEKYMNEITKTIKASILNAQPAELFTLSYATTDLQNNRRGEDRPLDPTANLMMARTLSGEWLGGLINFAVHGTSLEADNLFFSADAPGAIERGLEKFLQQENGSVRLINNPRVLFMNGAEGDVSPKHDQTMMGSEFASQTIAHWNELKPMNETWIVLEKKISLSKPTVDLKKCVDESWMPKGIKLGLGRFVSKTTVINQIHFGPLWLLTWPGEPTTEIGLKLKQVAMETGALDAWVFGLTNDHLGYFTTPEEFAKGGYETCVNFFGSQGGETILKAHKNLSTKN